MPDPSMRPIQSLIQDLESSSWSIRDKAAIALMDLGDERAIQPLLCAIAKPENANHRGTLVYALSAFNCEAFVEKLVDLVLTGNFEVSTGAFAIIEESASTIATIQRVREQLRKFELDDLVTDHHKTAFEALLALTAAT